MTRPSLSPQTSLWLLLLGSYLLLAVAYSLVIPPGEGADEVHHFRYVRFVREQMALPSPLADYTAEGYAQLVMAHHPPLYYGLAALWCAPCNLNDAEEALPYNPHFVWRINDARDGVAVHLPTAVSESLWSLRWLRLFSVLLGAITLTAVYRTARLLHDNLWLPAVATSLAVFNPTFFAISTTLHNDVLVTAGFALTLWWMVAMLAQSHRPTWAQVLLGSLLASLTLLTKLTGLVLLPLVGLTLLLVAWQPPYKIAWGWLISRGLVVLSTAVLLSGWWFGRNIQLYGSPLPVGDIMRQLFPHVYRESYTLPLILTELSNQLGQGFWGAFSYLHITVPEPVSRFWWLFTAVGLLGALLALWRARRQIRLADWRVQAWFVLLSTAVLVFSAIINLGTSMSGAGQPRYLMPVAGVIGLVLAVGWLAWLRVVRRLRPLPELLLLGLMPLYALGTLIFFIQPLYAPAPRLAALPATAVATNLALAPDLTLVGYELVPAVAPLGGQADLHLFWQKTATSDTDWLAHITLYDQFGAVVSEQQVWPEANSSTAVWPISNTLVMSRHPLAIPDYVAAGSSQLYLALSPSRSAPPSTEPLAVGTVRLAAPSVVAQLPASANKTSYQLGEQIELVGYTAVVNDNATLTLDLFWRANQPLNTDYTVFVQVLQNGQVIAQQDNQPNQNLYPTSAWEPDQIVQDSYTLQLPAPSGQASYQIITGLYEWPSLTRLPVQEDGQPRGDYIELTTLEFEGK